MLNRCCCCIVGDKWQACVHVRLYSRTLLQTHTETHMYTFELHIAGTPYPSPNPHNAATVDDYRTQADTTNRNMKTKYIYKRHNTHD